VVSDLEELREQARSHRAYGSYADGAAIRLRHVKNIEQAINIQHKNHVSFAPRSTLNL